MFGTSIHWTTFFYFLIDAFLVIFTLYISRKKLRNCHFRYLKLGLLFLAYNATGGFLPIKNFPGPFIIQYVITYGIAITLCIYIIYYLYKEYDIEIIKYHFSVRNLTILSIASFFILFLLPYLTTQSLKGARFFFTIPISIVALIFLWFFQQRISNSTKPNPFFRRRNNISIICVSCIALLPVLTLIGDYQWLTFTIMNLAFYLITVMEVDRYLYILENKTKMYEIFEFNNRQRKISFKSKIIYEDLTRREFEIAISIFKNLSYEEIARELFIAKKTVSKHASNIFRKTGVKNRREFLKRFYHKP